jgi:methionyl aminopeptidase
MLRPSIYKTPDELRMMVRPGQVTAAALAAAKETIRAGVTTLEVDAAAEKTILAAGGQSNFKLVDGYHHTICASVNEDIVHGIPSDRVLQPGDIISVDCGAIVDGWNGDSAITVVLPDPSRPERVAERETLSAVTLQALWHGIAQLSRAKHLNEVGAAIEDYVRSQGQFGILETYVGHGVGRDMHEEPTVFNYRVNRKGPEVKPGLVVAIEPMLTAGSNETRIREDGWTVTTTDGSMGCQWEHTVAVHADGIWVLTAEDGGLEGLAPFGITPTPIA